MLTAKTEDDVSQLEVYIYQGEEDNLYVHHEVLLPSMPLCVAWMNFNKDDPAVLGKEPSPSPRYSSGARGCARAP